MIVARSRLIYQKDQSISRGRAVRRGKRTAFTLIELLIVLSIIVLLIALLLPTLKIAREFGETTSCAGLIRHLQMGLLMYTAENKFWIPPFGNNDHITSNLTWNNHYILPYIGGGDTVNPQGQGNDIWYSIRCPSVPGGPPFGGSMNLNDVSPGAYLFVDGYGYIYTPRDWILIEDLNGNGTPDSMSTIKRYNGMFDWHQEGANFTFRDGSVRWHSINDWEMNVDGLWGP